MRPEISRLVYRCYAKVNLTLEILRRRADGYHELASLVHTVSLADDLTILPTSDSLIACRADELDLDAETNLVTVSARTLATATRTAAGAQLTLRKRIPVASGLGGGSTDAAATLVGLDRLWGTRLGYAGLLRLASDVGSDVPFLVRGGAAFMRGRGEVLEALPPLNEQWLVLAVPRHGLANKTAALFGALEPRHLSSGEATKRAVDLLRQGRRPRDADLVNGFSQPARFAFGGLGAAWATAERLCQRPFHLSGAGPTLFALAEGRRDAREQAKRLAGSGLATHAVRTVRRSRVVIRFASPGDMSYA